MNSLALLTLKGVHDFRGLHGPTIRGLFRLSRISPSFLICGRNPLIPRGLPVNADLRRSLLTKRALFFTVTLSVEGGMENCTGCGKAVPPASKFCEHCGAPAGARSKNSDTRLALIAGASGSVAMAGFLAGLTGILPSGVSTVIVMIGVSAGLRVLWAFTARSASSASRVRTARILSNVGLAVSLLSLIVALPRITAAGGLTLFFTDGMAQLWTLAILMAITLPVRTLGWRVFAGTALTGCLAITGLARFAGRPLIESLGTDNVFAVAIWVPITEELLKLIPVVIVLMIATRRFHLRPSALDVMLLGAWTAAGFAVYENATLGRGGFSLTAAPLLSLVFPGEGAGRAFGWPLMQTGHVGHTALISLSVALALLYGKRTKWPWWLLPLGALSAVLLEHCSQNAMVAGGLNEVVAKIAIVLSLGGWLCVILLAIGVVLALFWEWRIVGGRWNPAALTRLMPEEATRRSALLAQAQLRGAA